MNQGGDDFIKRLQATFAAEAMEHAVAFSSGLVELEHAAEALRQAALIEMVYREVHSLKGAARSVNNGEIESVCHALESLLSLLKRQEISLSDQLFDLLHQGADLLRRLVAALSGDLKTVEKGVIREFIKVLENAAQEAKTVFICPPATASASPPTEGAGAAGDVCPVSPVAALTPTDTIRVVVSKLESLLRQTEELIQLKLSAGHRTEELKSMRSALTSWKKKREQADDLLKRARDYLTVGAAAEKTGMAESAKLIEFLEFNDSWIRSLESRFSLFANLALQEERMINATIDNLLDDMRRVLMLPFSWLFEAYPILVRDLARQQGKQVRLVVSGEEIEIDRRVLEEMKDAFNHLIRNAVDHGLESPDERVRKGKSPQGLLSISILPKEGNKVQVVFADDGAGINTARLKAAARKMGLSLPDTTDGAEENQLLSLIFHSGLSTSEFVTSLSGRGIGLAIVREKVEKLGGGLVVESVLDQGTKFILTLPLTLSTLRVVVVRAGENFFAFPIINVDRVGRLNRQEIKTVENRQTVKFNGQTVPLVALAEVMGLPGAPSSGEKNSQLVLVSFAENRLAFLVDEIITEQEALVKGLGKQLKQVENIAGVTILGSGDLVAVINVADIIHSALQRATTAAPPAAPAPAQRTRTLLVVEDSITARTLLKNILEMAGYRVKTAVDGLDALSLLKTEDFDLVVSDVEMPRMNGFHLTRKIREDKRLSELPVILVTSLESREDREEGIEAGANAYLVKSGFDQANLLQVIKRFL